MKEINLLLPQLVVVLVKESSKNVETKCKWAPGYEEVLGNGQLDGRIWQISSKVGFWSSPASHDDVWSALTPSKERESVRKRPVVCGSCCDIEPKIPAGILTPGS